MGPYEELLDIFNSKGFALGNKPRSSVHRGGDWHKTVHVWIVNSSGELLLQKRSDAKESHPGLWDISSAGHITSGQTSIRAALREVEEELGLTLEPEDLKPLFTIRHQCIVNNGTFIDNELSDIYLVSIDMLDFSKLHLQTSEVSEVQWVHYKELKKLLKSVPHDFVAHEEEYEKLFLRLEMQERLRQL
jgi:isopentenyldiphosphate isomerase